MFRFLQRAGILAVVPLLFIGFSTQVRADKCDRDLATALLQIEQGRLEQTNLVLQASVDALRDINNWLQGSLTDYQAGNITLA